MANPAQTPQTMPEGGYDTPEAAARAIEDSLPLSLFGEKDEGQGEEQEKGEKKAPDDPPKSEDEPDEDSEEEADEEEDEADEEESDEIEEESDDGDEDQETALETFDDLSEALGVDKDQLTTLTLSTKVDGVESQVSIADLIKDHQSNVAAQKRFRELNEERKTFGAEMEEKRTKTEEKLHNLGTMLAALKQQVIGQVDSAEMMRLRAENPSEYLLKEADIRKSMSQFGALEHAAAKQYAELTEAREKEAQESFDKRVKTSLEKLPEVIPGWDDARYKQIMDYAIGTGAPAELVHGITDWQFIKMIDDARLYQETLKQGDAAAKKVKKTPKKVPKKVASKAGVKTSKKRLSRVGSQFKKDPNVRNAGEVALEILSQ